MTGRNGALPKKVHLTGPQLSRIGDAEAWLRGEIEAGRIDLKDAIAHIRAAPVRPRDPAEVTPAPKPTGT